MQHSKNLLQESSNDDIADSEVADSDVADNDVADLVSQDELTEVSLCWTRFDRADFHCTGFVRA